MREPEEPFFPYKMQKKKMKRKKLKIHTNT